MPIPFRFSRGAFLLDWPIESHSGLRLVNIIFIPQVICRSRIQPLFNQMLGAYRHVRELQTAALSGLIYPYYLPRAFDEIAHSRQLELNAYELVLTQVLNSLKPYSTLAGIHEDAPVAHPEIDIRQPLKSAPRVYPTVLNLGWLHCWN